MAISVACMNAYQSRGEITYYLLSVEGYKFNSILFNSILFYSIQFYPKEKLVASNAALWKSSSYRGSWLHREPHNLHQIQSCPRSQHSSPDSLHLPSLETSEVPPREEIMNAK